MTDRKFLIVGLGFSLLLHGCIILVLLFSKSDVVHRRKPMKSIEVTYQDLKSQEKLKQKKLFKDLKVIKDPKPYQEQNVKVLTKKENMFSAIGNRIKDISKLGGPLRTGKKKTQKIATLDLREKITISPMKTQKITNPQYLTYNDDMRTMISRNIKQRAYAYVNHEDFEAGKVYVTFMLAASGLLKEIKIIDAKTSANDYLRDVALRSIKESNPFPPFPAGFDYPEFTFNLLISFQN